MRKWAPRGRKKKKFLSLPKPREEERLPPTPIVRPCWGGGGGSRQSGDTAEEGRKERKGESESLEPNGQLDKKKKANRETPGKIARRKKKKGMKKGGFESWSRKKKSFFSAKKESAACHATLGMEGRGGGQSVNLYPEKKKITCL